MSTIIVIYGAPAVGKLTIARELANLNKYKILHNHLTVDLATSLFDRGTDSYKRLIKKIRLDLISESCKSNINLILTTCSAGGYKEEELKDIVKIAESHGVSVKFAHIFCKKETLLGRVESKDRKTYGKLVDISSLEEFLTQVDFSMPVTFVESLSIDNTNLSARDGAEMINEKFSLTKF